MTQLGSPEIAILTWLVGQEHGTIAEIGDACGIAFVSARGRLSVLEKQKLITGRSNGAVPPLKVYAVTAEGRRRVEG